MWGKNKQTSIWGWENSSHINLRVSEVVGRDGVARGAPLYILKPKNFAFFHKSGKQNSIENKRNIEHIFKGYNCYYCLSYSLAHNYEHRDLKLFARSWTDLFKFYRGTLCIIHILTGVERFTQYTLQLERTFTLVLPCSGVTDPKLLNSRQIIRLFSLSLAKPDMKILYARDALIVHKILFNCSILSAYNNVRHTYYRTYTGCLVNRFTYLYHCYLWVKTAFIFYNNELTLLWVNSLYWILYQVNVREW